MMHIPSLKRVTKHIPIQEIESPTELYLPLKGYKGNMEAIVQPGQHVKKYQLLAELSGVFAATLHAPVSGTVEGIFEINGEPHLKLINDFKDDEAQLPNINIDTLATADILKILKDYGIEGSGGARFPAHLKYNVSTPIDTFIINGAECEPYLSADYALIKNETTALLKAINILQRVINAGKIVIVIEKQHKELLPILKQYIVASGLPVSVHLLPNEYPQGGELQLIKSVTGKELAKGSIPATHGVVVSNIGTLWATYRAFYENKPYTERIITVSGEKAANKGNYLVKIGTPVSFILGQLGTGWDIHKQSVIMGGPMMGRVTHQPDATINKGTGGVLVLPNPKSDSYNCIQCGYCADVCPQHLLPMEFARHENNNNPKRLQAYHLADCIECGACAYSCPSDVPLMQSIFKGKQQLLAI